MKKTYTVPELSVFCYMESADILTLSSLDEGSALVWDLSDL